VLQVSGEVHEKALDRLGVPLCVADRDGVFLWMNKSAKRFFGDVIGRRFSKVVAPEQISHARRQFERKVTGQAAVTDYDLTLLDRSGRRVAARIHSVSLSSAGSGAAVFGAVIAASAEHGLDSSSADNRPAAVQLTGRQHQTLLLLGDGRGTSEIAAHLDIAVETARNHIRAVVSALGAHSRLEAVAIAHRIGLLPPQD
jgi:PAS domain S-box-containing protein